MMAEHGNDICAQGTHSAESKNADLVEGRGGLEGLGGEDETSKGELMHR